jgi:hypothetical protein
MSILFFVLSKIDSISARSFVHVLSIEIMTLLFRARARAN